MKTRHEVLVVEDNPADADLIRETLPDSGSVTFGVEVVPRLGDAIARLGRGGIDLVILDLGLPDSQGLSTFTRLRDAAPSVATIVLTGNDDLDLAISAVRAGAQDYLIKGQVFGNILERASRYAVERKQAEEAIRRLNLELDARVRERTAQLEQVNKELEAFSYSVSHDLRAPLRAMDGFASLLMEDHADRLDADGKAHLTRVRQASQHMSHLIDSLLQLSRLGRGPLRRVPVDLTALASGILAAHRDAEPGRSVEVVVEEGLEAVADPDLIRIALENLLGNAWKFTGATSAARIELRSRPDAAGRTVFFVKDNGAGFDNAYAGRLFGAFQRLHAANEFPGTGIGLATVARIVRRHGGEVWAEGEVGKGATVSFTLDAAEPQNGASES